MKYLFILIIAFSAFYSLQPVVVSAEYTGLVQCDGVVDTVVVDENGDLTDKPGGIRVQTDPSQKECNFRAFVLQIKYLMNWLFGLSIPVMVALLAWGGLLYMTGTKGHIDTAKKIFGTAAIGFSIMLVAWAVIYTLVTWITKSGLGLTDIFGVK